MEYWFVHGALVSESTAMFARGSVTEIIVVKHPGVSVAIVAPAQTAGLKRASVVAALPG